MRGGDSDGAGSGGGVECENMDDGPPKRNDRPDKNGEKSEKNEKSEKSPTLSIDRAAFLILRVKKAFKKKRQQRKDRQ